MQLSFGKNVNDSVCLRKPVHELVKMAVIWVALTTTTVLANNLGVGSITSQSLAIMADATSCRKSKMAAY